MDHTAAKTADRQAADDILNLPGAPVVMFDQVQLAFDDKVVLRNISFTLISGHTKIILGASGSGEMLTPEIRSGPPRRDAGGLRGDGAGVGWVNGRGVDQLIEKEMMTVRADLGMIFQEGALFVSLTVRENV